MVIMNRCKVCLRNMPDIVATCIVLHNLCIVNKEDIDEDWILETKNKLSRRIGEGEILEGSELRDERAEIAEMKRGILGNEDTSIQDEINDEEIEIFILKENEKTNDLLWKITKMHKLMAESLWQYKLRQNSTIVDSDSDSEIE